MIYLIDTCVISELRKARKNPGVVAWALSVPQGDTFLSVITLGEIRRGIELMRPVNPSHAAVLEQWFSTIGSAYSGRILSITPRIAERWGRLCPHQPLPAADASARE